ncbi:MAG: TldD/PmbA family protein [Dehalococcoidia bacterium]|nr:TldD/PmbA family protein [Dehalococcoidia bacterium]
MPNHIRREEIEAAVKGHNADYVEVRVEANESTRVAYRGRELDDIGQTTNLGGCARVCVKGGWGFITFNKLDDLRAKVDLAVQQARLVGNEKTDLAEVKPVVEIVKPYIVKDPRPIPLSKKKEYLDQYNEIIWRTPQIQTSSMRYGDTHKHVAFASSVGSYIEQERIDVVIGLAVMARDGSDVQQANLSHGTLGDFSLIEGLHAEVEATAKRAVAFLSALYAKGGEYTVVLDPILGGVFTHEAFGHLSEADFIYENDRMKDIMVLGKRFGGRHLNIVDGGAVGGLRGSFKYDDEGVEAKRTYLIREGELVGRLHSRETAAKLGEKPTGNARALDFHFPPIVRMTNTFIEPTKMSAKDIFADVKEGVYCKNWYGGMTSMEMFTFSAGEAYMIRNGKVEELMRPVVLSGNLFTTLENLDAVGDDLDMNQGGGCGKGGQFPLPVSNGAPHIRIQKCLVGGK